MAVAVEAAWAGAASPTSAASGSSRVVNPATARCLKRIERLLGGVGGIEDVGARLSLRTHGAARIERSGPRVNRSGPLWYACAKPQFTHRQSHLNPAARPRPAPQPADVRLHLTVITRGGVAVAAVVPMSDYSALEEAADELLTRRALWTPAEEDDASHATLADARTDIFGRPVPDGVQARALRILQAPGRLGDDLYRPRDRRLWQPVSAPRPVPKGRRPPPCWLCGPG